MTDMSVDPTAVFRQIRDDTFQPSALAVGPWNPGALHGGPPCALLAGVLERTVADAGLGIDFFPARFTAELSSPVPLADLTVTSPTRRSPGPTVRSRSRPRCCASADSHSTPEIRTMSRPLRVPRPGSRWHRR